MTGALLPGAIVGMLAGEADAVDTVRLLLALMMRETFSCGA